MRAIDVQVGTEPGDLDAVRLVALGRDRVRVGRSAALRPIPAGSSALVALGDGSGARLQVPARAGVPEERGGEQVFDLLFTVDPTAPDAERRGSIRVVPGADAPIEVYVDADDPADPPVRVGLVDIGEGGLCVDRPPSAFLVQAGLQVLLPGQSFPLALAVRLCHHRRVGTDRVRCGYEIDWERTVAAAEQEGTLAGWLGGYALLLARSLAR